MITQDELEQFIDGIIEPVYEPEQRCDGDACPIDFGGDKNE